VIIITTCREREKDGYTHVHTHTHTHTGAAHKDGEESNQQKCRKTAVLAVNHSSLCSHPAAAPPTKPSVDIRPVQKGSAQLIAGPLGVGGGVGETWVWVEVRGLGSSSSGDEEAYPAPSDTEVRGQAASAPQRNSTAVFWFFKR